MKIIAPKTDKTCWLATTNTIWLSFIIEHKWNPHTHEHEYEYAVSLLFLILCCCVVSCFFFGKYQCTMLKQRRTFKLRIPAKQPKAFQMTMMKRDPNTKRMNTRITCTFSTHGYLPLASSLSLCIRLCFGFAWLVRFAKTEQTKLSVDTKRYMFVSVIVTHSRNKKKRFVL